MSKGPGKWQQMILERLESGGFYLTDLLPTGYTLANYQSLHRAMTRLETMGKIKVVRWVAGAQRVYILPPGAPEPWDRIYPIRNKWERAERPKKPWWA